MTLKAGWARRVREAYPDWPLTLREKNPTVFPDSRVWRHRPAANLVELSSLYGPAILGASGELSPLPGVFRFGPEHRRMGCLP